MVEVIRSVYILMYHRIISLIGTEENREQENDGIKQVIGVEVNKKNLSELTGQKTKGRLLDSVKIQLNKNHQNQHQSGGMRLKTQILNDEEYKYCSDREEQPYKKLRSISTMVRAGPNCNNRLKGVMPMLN